MRQWHVREVKTISVIISSTGVVPENLNRILTESYTTGITLKKPLQCFIHVIFSVVYEWCLVNDIIIVIIIKFSDEIKMKFGVDKCRILRIRSGEIIPLQKSEPMSIQEMEMNELNKYLGIDFSGCLSSDVPQRSILGPLFFNNDIGRKLYVFHILCADDMNIFVDDVLTRKCKKGCRTRIWRTSIPFWGIKDGQYILDLIEEGLSNRSNAICKKILELQQAISTNLYIPFQKSAQC